MKKYKSKLEQKVAKLLGGKAEYEAEKIPFRQPEKERKYIPDWKLRENVYIETKGRLTFEDRQKHIWIKEQHPEITIFFLFGKADNKIAKNSPTTYAMWCENNGFDWADIKDGIPERWFE